ncbi:ESX secretion-associated protein EspG [Kibdelosporangium persicum]|uniref:ESX secretion-associated protein EspG n=1 Tax=Kibdelosporangium persicum TaxID=2698649 RepID=A0ABX2F4R7_9PSEU|nr:ESX secretion-associated protein EspG [Kibdelosporangium persicum]NRN66149.1 ESX secretion-associated protein EspG [Kibdelosporangium persicum]
MTPDFVISARELDFLWEHLELGRMPYPIDVPSNGATMQERDRMRAETLDPLIDRGLLRGQLPDLLRVLASPTMSVDTVGFADGPIRGLAASDGSQAVLATVYDDEVSIAAIRPTALARSIVELLPAGDPGTGNAISVPHQALQRAVDGESDDPFGDDDERGILVSNGVNEYDATALLELTERRIRGGQFGVNTTTRATRARAGASTRSKTMVTWFDTATGRYLVVHDGTWVSIAPAGADRIANRIDELLRAG